MLAANGASVVVNDLGSGRDGSGSDQSTAAEITGTGGARLDAGVI